MQDQCFSFLTSTFATPGGGQRCKHPRCPILVRRETFRIQVLVFSLLQKTYAHERESLSTAAWRSHMLKHSLQIPLGVCLWSTARLQEGVFADADISLLFSSSRYSPDSRACRILTEPIVLEQAGHHRDTDRPHRHLEPLQTHFEKRPLSSSSPRMFLDNWTLSRGFIATHWVYENMVEKAVSLHIFCLCMDCQHTRSLFQHS